MVFCHTTFGHSNLSCPLNLNNTRCQWIIFHLKPCHSRGILHLIVRFFRAYHNYKYHVNVYKIGINGFGASVVWSFAPLLIKDFSATNLKLSLSMIWFPPTIWLTAEVHLPNRFNGTVEAPSEDSLVVNGHEIRCLAAEGPSALPWGELGVDVDDAGLFVARSAATLRREPRRSLFQFSPRVTQTIVQGSMTQT